MHFLSASGSLHLSQFPLLNSSIISTYIIFISLSVVLYFMDFMDGTNTIQAWNIVSVAFFYPSSCVFLMMRVYSWAHSLSICTPSRVSFVIFFLFIWREFKAPRVSKRGLELRLGVGRFVSLVLIVINYGVLLIRARRGSLWRQHLLPVLTLTNNGNTRHHVNGRHLGLS